MFRKERKEKIIKLLRWHIHPPHCGTEAQQAERLCTILAKSVANQCNEGQKD